MADGSTINTMIVRLRGWLGALLLSWFMVGCATAPKIDWDGRVGSYTFDQAVLEFGPPDKSATLTDGAVVADWIVNRGRVHTYASPDAMLLRRGPYGLYTYGAYTPTESLRTPDRVLRLTFGSDKKLSAYRQFSR